MARLRTWLIASVLVHLLILIVTAVGYRPEKRRVTQPIAVRQLAPSVLKKQGTAAPLPLPPAPEVAQEEAVEEEPVAEAVEPEPVSPVAVAPTPPQKEIAKPAPKPSQKEVAKAEPKKTTKPSPKKTPVAKPKTPPKPAVAAKPKTPTQSAVTAKAPVKPAAKPMATKTTAKPAAAKPTASKKPPAKPGLTAAQRSALAKAQESIAKIGAPADKGTESAALSVPAAIQSLHIDGGEGGAEGSYEAQADYNRDVARRIKAALRLSEYGDVKVQLTISGDGRIEKMEVLKFASSSNRDYIAKVLPSVRLPALGPYFPGCTRLVCTLVLSNEES